MSKKGTWTLEREEWLRGNIHLSMERKMEFLHLSRDAINRKIRLLGLRTENGTKYQSKVTIDQLKYFYENQDRISRLEMIATLGITESYYYVLIEKQKLLVAPLNKQDRFIVDHYHSMTTKEISKCLGVSRNVVRNRLSVLPIERNIVICRSCGKEVIKGSNRQIYCPECRDKEDKRQAIEWGNKNPKRKYEQFRRYYERNRDKVLQRSYSFYDNFKIENGVEDKSLVSQKQLCYILDKLYPGEITIDDKFHTFLRSPTTNRLLQLDRYYPQLKLAFEYDGAQHFISIDGWGGEKTLRKVQRRDKEKDELCQGQGIQLVRIKYDERLSVKNIKNLLIQRGVL